MLVPVERVVTVSIGIASAVPEEPLRYSELIKLADNALSQAKRSGGNCVVSVDAVKRLDNESLD